jgi:hypothetical protein
MSTAYSRIASSYLPWRSSASATCRCTAGLIPFHSKSLGPLQFPRGVTHGMAEASLRPGDKYGQHDSRHPSLSNLDSLGAFRERLTRLWRRTLMDRTAGRTEFLGPACTGFQGRNPGSEFAQARL